ncbi:CYTH domain-containing protein [Microbacterium gilvum]|uniref:CYTH domain-containing protein n=1 Tax=Microbacterium gilvum TaxID=1336204 RepID=A0ABP8ZPL4_9MICO
MAADMAEPSRFVEVERKFDVDAGTPVPVWTGVAGVASVTDGELRHLDALYLDDDALSLGRAGVALRRRTGGPDAGWHIKGPLVDGARVELGWPLGDGDGVPEAVLAEVSAWTTAPLRPLARIVNDRTAYELLDADGGVVAEFVDDHVRTTDLRAGVEREWHEWEIELGESAPADPDVFFADVERAALAAGARDASSTSKLARALGR